MQIEKYEEKEKYRLELMWYVEQKLGKRDLSKVYRVKTKLKRF